MPKRKRRRKKPECPGGFKVGDRVVEIDGGARGYVEEIIPPEPFDWGPDADPSDGWIVVFRFDLGGAGDMEPEDIALLPIVERLAELDKPG